MLATKPRKHDHNEGASEYGAEIFIAASEGSPSTALGAKVLDLMQVFIGRPRKLERGWLWMGHAT